MRLPLIVLAVIVLVAGSYYAIWYMNMSAHVKRVEASIAYHADAFAKQDASVKFTVGKVSAVGFPFDSTVQVSGVKIDQETPFGNYGIALKRVSLTSVRENEGRYKVHLPADAVAYFKDASHDERYKVRVKDIPSLLLRAQPNSMKCPNILGAEPCADVAEDAPFISYAASLPSTLHLEVSLNGKTETIEFLFHSLNIPVFATIPDTAGKHLQLFVGMLREALVFRHEG